MTPIHRWFSGRKPEVTGPKLTFSRSNRHDCPVQPIESSADMPKLVIISRQSKKKWHFKGKKIHLDKIPLFTWRSSHYDWSNQLCFFCSLQSLRSIHSMWTFVTIYVPDVQGDIPPSLMVLFFLILILSGFVNLEHIFKNSFSVTRLLFWSV